jgi:hypothetical protein
MEEIHYVPHTKKCINFSAGTKATIYLERQYKEGPHTIKTSE